MSGSRARFTPEQVAAIRARREQGAKLTDLMAEFGISKTYASELCAGVLRDLKGHREDGLIYRVRAYFEANPDEELTYADIREKFSAGTRNAENSVAKLVRAGVVESVHVIRMRAEAKGGQ
jgi:hypothetical protein